MLRLFKKKRPPKEPMPRWLLWLVIAFFVYAGVTGSRESTPEAPNPVYETVQEAKENISSRVNLDLSSFTSIVFPSYGKSLKIKDTQTGKGKPIICGQEVTLSYQPFNTDGTPFTEDAGKTDSITFRVGSGKTMPAIDQGIIGMRAEGKRTIITPPAMAYGLKDFSLPAIPPEATVKLEVTVHKVSPDIPATENTPYRIANTLVGHSGLMLCGQETKVHITLWDTEGKKLFSSREKDNGQSPVSFTPGKSEVFLGLEQGVIGMNQGGSRVLVVPPAFQKTMFGNKPNHNFPLPMSKTVIVDVEAF